MDELVRVIDLSKAPGERQAWDRPAWVVYLWALCELVFVTNPFQPSSQLRVRVLRLFGATIEISKVAPDTYAGRLHDMPTELRISPGKITGNVGNLPTDLNVSWTGDTLRLQGIFGGAIGTLEVTPRLFRGKAATYS